MRNCVQRGRTVAHLLEGSWRSHQDKVGIPLEALADVAPLLCHTGAAGLVWYRLRETELHASPPAAELRREYQRQAIQAALQEREIAQIVSLLRAADVEPLLIKGWAAARSYARPYLRPYGDIDLCVRPSQTDQALAAIRHHHARVSEIDLHTGFSDEHIGYSLMDECELSELYDRSVLVPLGETEVRTLCPEDHLRLLCLHLLGHGACRPLWLCDIAAAVEARPTDFDWGLCLGKDRRRSDWISCALVVAHRLLGATIEDIPISLRSRRLPRWVIPTILNHWGEGIRTPRKMVHQLRQPLAALLELRHHWRDPIEATIELRAPFNDCPRLPFQIAAVLRRTARFLVALRAADLRAPGFRPQGNP